MDDTMESEVVCDLVMAHVYIVYRYILTTSAQFTNMFIPGPGETFQTKLLQPGPFMLLMLLMIIMSVAVQGTSNIIRSYICLPRVALPGIGTLGLGLTVADNAALKTLIDSVSGVDNGTLKTLIDSVSGAEKNYVVQEVQEGVVGVYAMQGRRATMEDRFSVLQNVSVADDKTLSFFGVYDGHGGQFVAEYVRTHLFQSTIEKIRQLCTEVESRKNGVLPSNTIRNSRKFSNKNNTNNRSSLEERKTEASDTVVDCKTVKNHINETNRISKSPKENSCEYNNEKRDNTKDNNDSEKSDEINEKKKKWFVH